MPQSNRPTTLLLDWPQEARRELRELAATPAGWSYRRGSSPHAEPTALACLALLATRPSPSEDPAAALVTSAADWLAKSQQADGSIGIAESVPRPGWMTPYALLVWKALGTHESESRKAVAWLLATKGRALDPRDDPSHIAGHDVTIVGWPWVANTHSWLEPTALAVLALGAAGFQSHPRVREGLRLIRDRVIDTGGWNYGNKAVFGRSLRPQPGPTGLALLALAGTEKRSPDIDRAIHYLDRALTGLQAAASLSWGLIGLRAWDAWPDNGMNWLAGSCSRVHGRPEAAPRLAALLLASSKNALELFGRGPISPESRS